jgi:hypothetical protein
VASVSASPNLAENYLYTVEAFKAYLRHLKPGGLLSISFPNVEGLDMRLFATGLRAMGEMGVQKPLDSMVLSETGGFVHLLVKWQAPFTADELDVLARHFDSGMIGIYFPLYYRLMGAGTPDFFLRRTVCCLRRRPPARIAIPITMTPGAGEMARRGWLASASRRGLPRMTGHTFSSATAGSLICRPCHSCSLHWRCWHSLLCSA